MPIYRRLPKRGFKNPFRIEFQIVNLDAFDRFEGEVTIEMLAEAGMINLAKGPIKLLGRGEITKALKIHADAASQSAIEKVKQAGGEIVLPALPSE